MILCFSIMQSFQTIFNPNSLPQLYGYCCNPFGESFRFMIVQDNFKYYLIEDKLRQSGSGDVSIYKVVLAYVSSRLGGAIDYFYELYNGMEQQRDIEIFEIVYFIVSPVLGIICIILPVMEACVTYVGALCDITICLESMGS